MPKPGYLTPSTFSDLMSNGRGSNEMGQTALAVVDRLVLDLIGAERPEEGTPSSCQWGLDHEWEAIDTYSERNMCEVVRPDFRVCRDYPFIGGTADGLVGRDGLIEVKNPFNMLEHMYNLLSGKQVPQYINKMYGYMLIYERDWSDFVSFDTRFPEALKLYTQRVPRDDELIRRIVERCVMAHDMALDKAEKILARAR
jgi:hypothetical protein